MEGLLYNKKNMPLASPLLKNNSNHPKLQKILKQPLYYIFLLRLNDGRIALYERVNTFTLYPYENRTLIKICNPKDNYNCDIIITLNEPISNSNICQFDNGSIVICLNSDINIYSISNNYAQCVHQIKNAHTEKISNVTALTWKRFATTSDDHNIYIWSSMTYELICTMTDSKLSDITSMMQLKEKEVLVQMIILDV